MKRDFRVWGGGGFAVSVPRTKLLTTTKGGDAGAQVRHKGDEGEERSIDPPFEAQREQCDRRKLHPALHQHIRAAEI